MSKSMPIDRAVRRKWATPAEKEWWYQKFAAARRRKLVRLSEQQNHRCCYCGRLTWLFDASVKSSLPSHQPDRLAGMSNGCMATLEHLVAVSLGGGEHISNLVMSCYRCNTLRGNRLTALEFWTIMHDPVQYHSFIRQRRLWGRQLRKELRSEKQQTRYDQTVFWLAYLGAASPVLRQVLAAWSGWLDQQLQHRLTAIEGRLSYYAEATCLDGPESGTPSR